MPLHELRVYLRRSIRQNESVNPKGQEMKKSLSTSRHCSGTRFEGLSKPTKILGQNNLCADAYKITVTSVNSLSQLTQYKFVRTF
jgi:hypothetical protein